MGAHAFRFRCRWVRGDALGEVRCPFFICLQPVLVAVALIRSLSMIVSVFSPSAGPERPGGPCPLMPLLNTPYPCFYPWAGSRSPPVFSAGSRLLPGGSSRGRAPLFPIRSGGVYAARSDSGAGELARRRRNRFLTDLTCALRARVKSAKKGSPRGGNVPPCASIRSGGVYAARRKTRAGQLAARRGFSFLTDLTCALRARVKSAKKGSP